MVFSSKVVNLMILERTHFLGVEQTLTCIYLINASFSGLTGYEWYYF